MEEQLAFDTHWERITSALILTLPDNSRPYCVEADSSDFATGAVLSQECLEDGKWHPIAFLSKSLSPVKRNYEIHDKEMLAIVRALEEWWHFLEGVEHQFKIWMDHKNLEYFMMAKKLNWRQVLSYDFPGSFQNRKYAENNSRQERTKSGTLPVTDKDLASTYVLCHPSPTCPWFWMERKYFWSEVRKEGKLSWDSKLTMTRQVLDV